MQTTESDRNAKGEYKLRPFSRQSISKSGDRPMLKETDGLLFPEGFVPNAALVGFQAMTEPSTSMVDEIDRALSFHLTLHSHFASLKRDFSPVNLHADGFEKLPGYMGFPETARRPLARALAESLGAYLKHNRMEGPWGKVELVDESIMFYPRNMAPTDADASRMGAAT